MTEKKKKLYRIEECLRKKYSKKSEHADRLYLDVLLKEYEMERNKKQSLETRAGFVITILCALSVFIFDKVSLSDIVQNVKVILFGIKYLLFNKKVIFLKFSVVFYSKTVIGLLVYIFYGIALGYSIKVIGIQKLCDIKLDWKPKNLYQDENLTTETFVHQYLHVVLRNRKTNNLKAKRLPVAYLSSIVTISLIMLYNSY